MCEKVIVKRNNEITLEEVDEYDKIILSPGPGLPKDAGRMLEVIKMYSLKKPILGVCLGMQGIAQVFGGELYNQDRVRHGVTTTIRTAPGSLLFKDLPSEIQVGLYHSWAVNGLTKDFIITALSDENVIMAIEHSYLPIYGVQFHPESILTKYGKEMLQNFIEFT